MELTSSVFANGAEIPAKYTCDEDRKLSPPLFFSRVPGEARALALLVDDPDIPEEKKKEFGLDSFDHWTLYDIPPTTEGIPEGESAGTCGVTSRGEEGYTGPCPPPDLEPAEHRYFFRLYALSELLNLSAGATKMEVLSAMEGRILETAELIGRYKRR